MVTPSETRHWVNRTSSTPHNKAATWVVKLHIRRTAKMLNWQNLQSFRSYYVLVIFALVCINADDFCEFRVSSTPRHSYKLYEHFSNCTPPSSFRDISTFFEIISGHLADNHASTPPLSFLQAGCPSCHPTNSVKALTILKLIWNV